MIDCLLLLGKTDSTTLFCFAVTIQCLLINLSSTDEGEYLLHHVNLRTLNVNIRIENAPETIMFKEPLHSRGWSSGNQ